jgi:hypothetical protein
MSIVTYIKSVRLFQGERDAVYPDVVCKWCEKEKTTYLYKYSMIRI